jgi:hypothetical protein
MQNFQFKIRTETFALAEKQRKFKICGAHQTAWLFLFNFAFLIFNSARAAIPEPDNLIYGSIVLDNVPMTAARTDVVVEARRTVNGPAIATYRLGDNPALGDFYALSLTLESVAPVTNTNVSQVGESVFITVLEGGNLRGQTGFLITERGIAQRIDFGAAVVDGDGDGLPDAWELVHFAGLGTNVNSLAANGQSVGDHYLAGTDPNDPNDGFRLLLTDSNGMKRVSFTTREASGPGYEGLSRRYTLESKTALSLPTWVGVSGLINVPGTNQTVVYETAGQTGSAFFRGKISLEPAGAANPDDTDGDGLPDVWEQHHFGNLNTNAASVNLNGQTALQNYVAGTAPNSPGSVFQISSTISNGVRVISFPTILAAGIGYDGLQRYYALESGPSPVGPWQPVNGVNGILATNQTVTHQAAGQAAPIYYRGRVWLQP